MLSTAAQACAAGERTPELAGAEALCSAVSLANCCDVSKHRRQTGEAVKKIVRAGHMSVLYTDTQTRSQLPSEVLH